MAHMSLNLTDPAITNKATLYCLSPHTRHLQLLDISVYEPLKNYHIILASVTHGTTRKAINKAIFLIVFKDTFTKTWRSFLAFPHPGYVNSTLKLSQKKDYYSWMVPQLPIEPEPTSYSSSESLDEWIKTGLQNPIFQTPATYQDLSTDSETFQNPLASTAGLISPELAQILPPVKYKKIKISRIIIEQQLLTEYLWSKKIEYKEKNTERIT